MEKMKEHFFVVYDFAKDSRRTKFAKILEKYGIRVQYSVFEFSLTKARKIELFSKIKEKDFLNDKKGEAIMVVPVSKDFSEKIERFGETIDLIGKAGIFSI